MSKRWFCVQAKARQEFFACHNLELQGFRPLLLTENRPIFGNGRARKISKPVDHQLISLFGPYFFIRFDPDSDHWKPIAYTYGVKRILGASPESPTPIAEHIMDGLLASRETKEESGIVSIHRGCSVRVISGPLASDAIYFVQWSNRDRAKLLLEAMNGSIVVEFAISALELVT